ncbi:CHASE2 domain-containing protein [Solirubrobacter soli]|uniref:CHASE2 domain-containing protein n=1 Tax=Solirubrobacter soli TaxID=363832 RepID=UPI00040574E3|nr:adenylate/guanylate cyclase domain-containing protein [Solirubrobacter soli]
MNVDRGRRRFVLLAVALLAMGVAVLLTATDGFKGLEQSTIDARFKLRGAEKPPSDIVVVGVDDKTLAGGSLPLNRSRHAKVIEQLTKAGAGVIGYDFQFTSESEDPDADNALIEAVAAAKKIVLGTGDVNTDGTTAIFGGGEGLKYSGATPADTRFLADESGEDNEGDRVRRMPFALQGLDNFPIAVAKLARGSAFHVPKGKDALIDFPGPPGTIPVLSFADVESGRFDPAKIRGKIVIVGATSPRANDELATATSGGGLMPRPEVEAAAVSTALRGFPMRAPAAWLDLLLALLVAAAAPLLALRFRVVIAFGAGLVVLLAYLVAAQLAFGNDVVMTVVPVLAGAVVGLLGTAAVSRPTESPAINRVLDLVTRSGGNQRTRRVRALLLLVAGFSVVSVTLLADAAKLLRNVDYSTVDMRFSLRGEKPAPKDVVIVAIDDKTLTTDPKPSYPLPRDWYADTIRNLTKAGAKVLAVDVQFSEASEEPKKDNALIESLHDARNVILSTTESDSAGGTQLFSFGKGLAYTGGQPAITLVVKDSDGRVRRLLFGKQMLTSFPVAAAEAYLGRPIVRPQGRSAWIDYAGKDHTVSYLSLLDVKNGRFDPAAVRGKVVVIGATQSSLQDQHNTSTTRNFLMPGPEIQANSIATALEDFPLHRAPWWLDVILIVVVGAVAPLAGLRFGVRTAVLAGVVAVAAFLVLAQVLFQRENVIVTVVYPLVAGVAAILLTAAIHGLTVAFEREQARDAFARFVPEAVVDQVLADAEGVRLGGVRGEATVMFSDLRGFTSFSETLEPERVIESLNRYLTEMSEAILDHGGTLVAYMGDGIMAVFGAPLKQEDHADRALEAARDMLSRMETFNGWLREQELHDGFKMGIGLNSGPVMSGNVGSERRLEYTALGDTTNTAARLEGMTKGTPHQLFIADTTKQRLTRPADDLVAVGEAEVRGRKAKVLLWSLKDSTPPAPASEASATVEA